MRYRKLSDLQRDIETLEGDWELSPGHELMYKERGMGNGKRETGAGFKVALVASEPDALVVSVTVNLTSREKDPLGVEVVLTKDLFDDNVQTFVRFRESMKETALNAGIIIPW